MNDKLQHFFDSIIPFALIGISIAIGFSLLFLFFHLVVWGLIIGAVLWLFTLAKQYLFSPKPLEKDRGRIIEHDENEK